MWSTQTSIEPVPEYKSAYIVDKIAPLFWREHCLECAMPLCYKTCPLYVPRMDGRCLRFDHGIVPIRTNCNIGFSAFIEFRRWSKLQTNFPKYPSLVDNKEIVSISKRYVKIEIFFRSICDIIHNYRLAQICTSLIERLNTRKLNNICPLPDGLLVTVFNFSNESKHLMVEILEDDISVFKTSITLDSGWNEELVPMSKIRMPSVNSKKSQLRVYLNENETGKFLFQHLDLVKLLNDVKLKPAKSVKCVAWDLDNTLWSGVIGDDGADAVIPFEHSLKLIKELDERGIIQTIVSKNTLEVAWTKIKDLGLEDYFLYPAINWGRKSQSLIGIAKELNINIDTFAVIDDSLFERNEISTSLPQVRVYDAIEIPSLLELKEFDVPITNESKNRRKSYLNEYQRKNVQASWEGDYDSFLKSCDLSMEIFTPTQDTDRVRCLELILRSNQYNVTGVKYQKEEFFDMLEDSNFDCFAFRVFDSYGDYGIVGFASFIKLGSVYELHDFVMSCRVALKKIERAFFYSITEYLKSTSFDMLEIKAIKTVRNTPLREQLDGMDFIKVEDTDSEAIYRFNIGSNFADDEIVKVTSHV